MWESHDQDDSETAKSAGHDYSFRHDCDVDGGNPFNKFKGSERNKLKYNPDGSLTLYFQKKWPGKNKQANWLPGPGRDFIPMLRMYWPKETSSSVLDGTWTVPGVKQAP